MFAYKTSWKSGGLTILQGTLQINHITDKILADSVEEVVIARPGWFQENWADALSTAKADQPFFEAYFSPADHKIPMVRLGSRENTSARSPTDGMD